jgi:hypothetical protein
MKNELQSPVSFRTRMSAIRTTIAFALLAQMIPLSPALADDSQLFQAGQPGCETCQAGEYKIRVSTTIPHAAYAYHDEPACGSTPPPVQQLGNAVKAGVEAYYGDVDVKAIGAALANAADALNIGGTVGSILHQNQPTYSACKNICAIVPEGAQVTGTKYQLTALFHAAPGQMEDVVGSEPPSPHQDWARIHTAQQSGRAVCSMVSNWSGDKSRTVIMDVFFTSEVKPIPAHP